MKLIALIYSSSNIIDSLNIKSFFELAGVCIYMINTDIKIDNSNKNRVLVLSDAIVCTVDRAYGAVCKLYDKCILYSSLPDLLNQFLKDSIVNKSEYNDLMALCDIYNGHEEQYVRTVLFGRDYFRHRSHTYMEEIYKDYIDISTDILDLLRNKNVPLWDSDGYLHCKYAVADIFYEMNLFCKKNGINYYMDNDSIINICSHNEEYLGNSFIMLKARVYDNLVEKPETAFQLYNECCNDDCNSKVFLYKAEMMDKINNTNRAKNYYNKSLSIDSQCYKAWSKLGCNYLKCKSYANAYACYYNVILNLQNKMAAGNLTIVDYDYMYNAYINMIQIDIILNNHVRALELCKRALEMYKSIESNQFYSKYKVDYSYVREDMAFILDTAVLKKYGIELSSGYGLFDLCKEFSEL